jgi:ABC-type branched-subunit amino acid transport system ATPase component
MDVAFGFADMVTVLDKGRVLFEGHRDEVSANARVQDVYLGVPEA